MIYQINKIDCKNLNLVNHDNLDNPILSFRQTIFRFCLLRDLRVLRG